MRFYLLDRITLLEKNQSIKAVKCWTQTEDFFTDHFPTFPIVPGVLIIEAMSQALGILMEQSYATAFPEEPDGIWSILTMVQKTKFRKFTIPGDRMILDGKLLSMDKGFGTGQVKAYVDDELRVVSDISLVFFPKKKMMNDTIIQQRETYLNYLLQGHKANELML